MIHSTEEAVSFVAEVSEKVLPIIDPQNVELALQVYALNGILLGMSLGSRKNTLTESLIEKYQIFKKHFL